MGAFRALYLANAREFVRDKLAMTITIIMPLLFAGFFGVIFGRSGEGIRIQLGLMVQDSGPAGQQIASLLEGDRTIGTVSTRRGEMDPLLESLRAGDLHVILVLPEGLTQRMSSGQPTALPVYYDPTSQVSSGVGLGFVRSFLSQANLAIASAPELLTAEPLSVQVERQSPASFYVPSMLGLAILWLGVFGTAMPLVEMREKKVLRRLAVAPLSTRTMLAGQVAWRVTVGIAQAVLFVAFGILVLGLNPGNQFLLFPAIVLLGAVAFVTMGYFIAALSPSSEAAVAVAQVVNFAMTFLSGSFFEAELLPSVLRPVMYVMPLTYLSDALRQVMVDFRPMFPLWLDAAVLGALLLLLVPLTIKFWRWE
ncbi:MAG: ABC transporter permease [Anaerolineae bacterium]|nr:ABC transporter permease [Anaerolineae bacterium]